MKKVLFCTLLFFVFLLSACKNVSTSGVENTQSDSKFAAINFAEPDLSRALSEAYNPLEVTDKDIVKVELVAYGKKTVGSEVSDYEAEIFTSVNDSGSVGKKEWTGESCFTKFKSERLFMFPGTYDFSLNIYTVNINNEQRLTLSAKLLGQELEAGKTKTLKFSASYAEEGDLSITYKWPSKDRVGKVKMGLYNIDDLNNPVVGYAMKDIPFVEKDDEYYSAEYKTYDLSNGVYYLKIELYDTNTENPEVIATYLDLVSIYGYKTTGTKVLDSSDYNQNYFINYHLADDESIMGWNAPDKHNQYQAVILYNGGVEKNPNGNVRYQFEGWYTDPDFSPDSKIPVGTIGTGDNEEEVQIIALGTELHKKDITLYPKFEQLVLYYINIGGDTPIQAVEEIVVKDKDGTQILDSSEEHSWYDYFKKFEDNVYTVGSKSPFADITSISRRGYNLRWNVVYERKDGTTGETFLDSLPVSDCGTLVFTDENGKTITYNDIISINVAASWISYQTDLNYYFMSEDNSYQQKNPDILSKTLSDEYNPEEEYRRNSIAELFDGGYVLNKAKSTYNCDAEVHEIVINNYFDKLDSDLAFKAESGEGRIFNFYYTDLTTGDGIFNISNTFTENGVSYTAYEYLGIGRYVENKLSLLYLWDYAKRGVSNEYTYESIIDIEDYGQSAAWEYFNELVSSGDPVNGFEQLTVTTDTGVFFNSTITGSSIKYTIDSSSVGTIVHNAFNQNREIGSLVINVSTDNLSGYTNANPADLNAKPSLSFDIKHGDGTAMKADDIISVNIDLLWNNANLISWGDRKLENTYFYVNNEPDDPDTTVLNPANDTQTIYFKSLPNAGTYQLYIKVSWAVDDNLVYTGSYSTTFVVNDTLKYDLNSLLNPTDIKKDLENANGIVNVKISGDYAGYSEWAAVIENLSIALSDGFITNDRNGFFVNLDLSGIENMSTFSNGIKNEYNNVEGTKGKLLTLKFPSSVSIINQDAVKGFGNLYTIELPANVTDINSNAFEGSGRKFILDESNETFALGSNGTVILGNDDKNLIAFAGGKKQLLIPDTVTSLPYDINTSNVESLYVPDSIEDIQSLDTSNLKELSINAQVTSVSANGTLTDTLPYLQKLTLRGDYTGENDFVAPTFQSGDSPKYPVGTNVAKILAYCADTLTDLTFDGDVVIPETPFSNPKSYSQYNDWCVNFFTRFTQKDSDGYEVSETKLKSLTFNGAATIGKQAFYDCRELEYVSPNVKTLNLTVFDSEGVIIEFNGDSPKTIGEQAFAQRLNTSAKFAHIKLEGVTSIGESAFAPLNLTGNNPYVEFSNSLVKLGKDALNIKINGSAPSSYENYVKGLDYTGWYKAKAKTDAEDEVIQTEKETWDAYTGLSSDALAATDGFEAVEFSDVDEFFNKLISGNKNGSGWVDVLYLVRPTSN